MISKTNGVFPSVTETVTSEVKAGQTTAVAAKDKSVGSFNGSNVTGFVTKIHPLASRTVIS